MAAKKRAKKKAKTARPVKARAKKAAAKRAAPKRATAKKVAAKKVAAKRAAARKTAAPPEAAPTASRFGAYLPQMYKDRYYPDALVDKVKAQLAGLVALLEQGPQSLDAVQARCDEMTDGINGLEEEFVEADSELETVAREDIAETVARILAAYGVDLDLETALRNREW
jgi:hypothetical protein